MIEAGLTNRQLQQLTVAAVMLAWPFLRRSSPLKRGDVGRGFSAAPLFDMTAVRHASLRTVPVGLCIRKLHGLLKRAREVRRCRGPMLTFYSAPHCKRCTSYGSPSVHPSVTRRYCVKTTARSTMQFAVSDSKMCLVL